MHSSLEDPYRYSDTLLQLSVGTELMRLLEEQLWRLRAFLAGQRAPSVSHHQALPDGRQGLGDGAADPFGSAFVH